MYFQRLLLLFVASNSGKKYWDWTLPRIRGQIELSSTFVYDYKMSTSGSSARNSHLTQGGRTTMMTMPVNRITSQYKIKLSQKCSPWINLQLWNFCHSFLQWMGIFFLIIMFCSAMHVYTDRSTDMSIIVIRSPLAEVWIPRRAAARGHFQVLNKGACIDSSIWASIQGSLQFQYLFPELEVAYSRKSRWGCIFNKVTRMGSHIFGFWVAKINPSTSPTPSQEQKHDNWGRDCLLLLYFGN